jgi:hypothetical protein
MVLADDGIAFPVTYACFLSNDGRAIINADTVLDRDIVKSGVWPVCSMKRQAASFR